MEMPWPTCPTHNTEPVRQEDFTSLLVLEEVPGEKITRLTLNESVVIS
jgi:hypothetical protein